MSFQDEEIRNLHQELQGGPFYQSKPKSLISSVHIPEEGDLFLENTGFHLGALRPVFQSFDIHIINPAKLPQKILSIKAEGSGGAFVEAFTKSFANISIPGLSSKNVTIQLELSSQDSGFYQIRLFFIPKDGLPLKADINWAVLKEGKILKSNYSEQKNKEISLTFKKKQFSNTKIDLGQVYSRAGKKYFCESLNSKRVFIVDFETNENGLMNLFKPGLHSYFTRSFSPPDFFYFKNEKDFQISGFLSREIFYNDLLEQAQCIDADVDRFSLIIKKNSKNPFRIEALPDWLKEENHTNTNSQTAFELSIKPDQIKWGENQGNIQLSMSNKRYALKIFCLQLHESLVPVSVAESVNLTHSKVDKDNILYGEIPVQVIGAGTCSVSLGEAAIEHSGVIQDFESENLRTLLYPIMIHLNHLNIDKVSKLPLKLFLGSPYDDNKIFETKLLLQNKRWTKTIDDVLFFQLFKGERRKHLFKYVFDEDVSISHLKDVVLLNKSSRYKVTRENESFQICIIKNGRTFPLVHISFLKDNNFLLDVDTAKVLDSIVFDIPVYLDINLDGTTFRDRLEIFGEISVADLEIQKVDKVLENGYSVSGKLILRNPTNSDLNITGYEQPALPIILFSEKGFLNFPIVIQKRKEVLIKYSYQKSSNQLPYLLFECNNTSGEKVRVDL